MAKHLPPTTDQEWQEAWREFVSLLNKDALNGLWCGASGGDLFDADARTNHKDDLQRGKKIAELRRVNKIFKGLLERDEANEEE